MSMSRLSSIMLMKKLAAQNFNLGEVQFNGFDEIKQTSLVNISDENGDTTNQLDIWADMSIKFKGMYPDSYRVLNAMIMDWVDENEDKIKKVINSKLKEFLRTNYPDIDVSDVDEDFDDYIWEDQVDYYPEIDEENGVIHFSLELVLDLEDEDIDENEEDETDNESSEEDKDI